MRQWRLTWPDRSNSAPWLLTSPAAAEKPGLAGSLVTTLRLRMSNSAALAPSVFCAFSHLAPSSSARPLSGSKPLPAASVPLLGRKDLPALAYTVHCSVGSQLRPTRGEVDEGSCWVLPLVRRLSRVCSYRSSRRPAIRRHCGASSSTSCR